MYEVEEWVLLASPSALGRCEQLEKFPVPEFVWVLPTVLNNLFIFL